MWNSAALKKTLFEEAEYVAAASPPGASAAVAALLLPTARLVGGKLGLQRLGQLWARCDCRVS